MTATPPDIRDVLPAGVLGITSEIQPEHLENARILQTMRDDSWALQAVVTAWKDERDLDRSLREKYAQATLLGLGVEIVFAIVSFFLIGSGCLKVDQWVANTFFVVVFMQIAAAAHAIIKYLFPAGRSDTMIADVLKMRTPSSPRKKERR